MGGKVFTPNQDNWKWFSDDNAEPVGGDALAAENTEPTLANNSDKIRLRLRIDEIGGANGTNLPLTLEHSINGVDWFSVDAANDFDYADGLGTEGNNVSSFLLTGTNDAGEYHESGTNQDTYSSNTETELDVCIVPTGNVSPTTSYEFRTSLNAVLVPLAGGASYPAVTTAAAAADETIAQARSISRFVFSGVFGRVN